MYYIAHRLFSAHDRALAARIAHRLAVKTGRERVFLPFCDTDEENLVAEIKGLRLFQLDRARLRRLTAMIAVLHGPSLDDGVCMELGYAAALGVPTVVLTTDFLTYSLTEKGPRLAFPDPLVEVVTGTVVHVERLGPVPARHFSEDRFEVFMERNNCQVDDAVDAAVDAVLHAADAVSVAAVTPGSVFIEPSPYTADRIVPAGGRHRIHAARRFAAFDPRVGARADWIAATSSEILIADVSGPESPPGAALLVGAASAFGHTILLYQPRPAFTHAHGREPNQRNLMIEYAATARVTSVGQLSEWLSR